MPEAITIVLIICSVKKCCDKLRIYLVFYQLYNTRIYFCILIIFWTLYSFIPYYCLYDNQKIFFKYFERMFYIILKSIQL